METKAGLANIVEMRNSQNHRNGFSYSLCNNLRTERYMYVYSVIPRVLNTVTLDFSAFQIYDTNLQKVEY